MDSVAARESSHEKRDQLRTPFYFCELRGVPAPASNGITELCWGAMPFLAGVVGILPHPNSHVGAAQFPDQACLRGIVRAPEPLDQACAWSLSVSCCRDRLRRVPSCRGCSTPLSRYSHSIGISRSRARRISAIPVLASGSFSSSAQHTKTKSNLFDLGASLRSASRVARRDFSAGAVSGSFLLALRITVARSRACLRCGLRGCPRPPPCR
jgi:hypothetical protein